MIRHRTAKTRHTRRHNPHGVRAAHLIAAHMPPGTRDFAISDDTAELFLPGLLPAVVR